MSTTDDTQQPEPVDEHQDQEVTEPTEDEATEDAGANREAARYRKRLRETEGERDQLAERLNAMRRTEVERLAGDTLRVPSALWASGVDLADLLDEQGNIDQAKVKAAAASALDSLGLERRRQNHVPREGSYAAARGRRSMVDHVMGRD